ncbi:hypothetical protein QFC20_003642 [Naganishia adeliensis]|uniref:Uncharacterized protein n=1 Tax=Naganishia adeliensis TaxID=92952 RepID=A0ACC2WBL5_9TREE|nr:hypothetical protein QFC20_003642 [Naganishia adeliensis]
MSPYAVRYDPAAAPETGSVEEYKLLEVSAELAKAIEQASKDGDQHVRLTMKGTPADDAVICTPTQTFTLRTITVSNSMLFLRPDETTQDLYIQDTCHEILELTPSVPRLARVEKLLRETSWEGIRGTKRTRDEFGESGERTKGRKRYTRAQLQSVIQSSDAELDAGFRARNVIEVNGHLILLPTKHLFPLLSTALQLLTIHSLDPLSHAAQRRPTTNTRRAPAGPIVEHLETEYSVEPDITRAVMRLCGDLQDSTDEVWTADLERIVKEVGKGLLSLESAHEPPTRDGFLKKWREQVGEEYEHVLDLSLLEGEYLLRDPLNSTFTKQPHLIPFSVSSLPTDPAQRFTDLFLTRAQWRPEDMQPFLKGLTPEGDRKAMDKLVVKYVRVVKESGKAGNRVWWHARR